VVRHGFRAKSVLDAPECIFARRQPLPSGYDLVMASDKVWTAEELEELSPNELRAGFEKDLSKVPPDLVERSRRKIEAHIAANDAAPAKEQ